MIDIPAYQQFLFSFLATAGFSIFFNVEPKLLVPASLAGGLGWLTYCGVYIMTKSTAFASFCGAAVVALLSEIMARKLKQPAIIFVIPGILPLIPGIGLYKTMLYIIANQYNLAAQKGGEAMLMGGGIALGLLIVTSLSKTFNIFKLRRAIKNQAENSYSVLINMGKIRSKNNNFDDYARDIKDNMNIKENENSQKDEFSNINIQNYNLHKEIIEKINTHSKNINNTNKENVEDDKNISSEKNEEKVFTQDKDIKTDILRKDDDDVINKINLYALSEEEISDSYNDNKNTEKNAEYKKFFDTKALKLKKAKRKEIKNNPSNNEDNKE